MSLTVQDCVMVKGNLRWNSDDTVFDWESFKCQSCRYWHMVFMSLGKFSSTLSILDAE